MSFASSDRNSIAFSCPNWLVRPFVGTAVLGIASPLELDGELGFRAQPDLFRSSRRNFLVDGDIAAHLVPVDAHPIARRIAELHAASWQYRETESYRDFVRLAESGQLWPFKGCPRRTRADVDAYFDYVVRLARSIERHGYVSGLTGRPAGARRGRAGAFAPGPRPDDIGCGLDPDGGLFFFNSGHHRLAICRALGIDSAAIMVHLIHRTWLARHAGARRPLLWGVRAAVENAVVQARQPHARLRAPPRRSAPCPASSP